MDNHPNALNTSEQAPPRPSGPVWLTYVELGDRLGITPDAARQKAIRGHWRKQRGNDGKARVLVEAEVPQRPVQTHPNGNHADDHLDERMVPEKPVQSLADELSSDTHPPEVALGGVLDDKFGYLRTLRDGEGTRAEGFAR